MNNLQNYFTRIGYAEDPSISLATLEKLQQLHTSVIPFENIDVLLGLDVDFKPEAIEKKLLVQGRVVIPRPLRFGTSDAQTTNHEVFRIIEHRLFPTWFLNNSYFRTILNGNRCLNVSWRLLNKLV
ncbi:MAG: arylamine N-acetyltransferase [Ketobacter sp.]